MTKTVCDICGRDATNHLILGALHIEYVEDIEFDLCPNCTRYICAKICKLIKKVKRIKEDENESSSESNQDSN